MCRYRGGLGCAGIAAGSGYYRRCRVPGIAAVCGAVRTCRYMCARALHVVYGVGMVNGSNGRTACPAVRRIGETPVINRTRTATDTHIVIYGGSMSSGSLLETYHPSLSAAVAYHDELLAHHYVAAEPWQLDARVESLAVLDAMDSDSDDAADVIPAYPTCKRCTAVDTDQYTIGDDWRGWYCSRCAEYMVAAVWYGTPPVLSATRDGIRAVAADNGWQYEPLHATASRIDDVFTRDGMRVNVVYSGTNGRFVTGYLIDDAHPTAGSDVDGIAADTRRVADVRAWLAGSADAIVSDAADTGITELPAGSDDLVIDRMRVTLNRGLMVAWINRDLFNRANCDVRKSIVLWDETRTFVMALSTAVTPAIFRERMPLVAASMSAMGVRYWSIGIANN